MVRNAVRSLKCCVAWWVGSVGVGSGWAAWGATLHNSLIWQLWSLRWPSGGCAYKIYYVKYALGLFLVAWFFALSIRRTLCGCGGSLRGCCGQAHCVGGWPLAKTMTPKKRRDGKSGACRCAKEVRGTSTIAHLQAGAGVGILLTFISSQNLFEPSWCIRAFPMKCYQIYKVEDWKDTYHKPFKPF